MFELGEVVDRAAPLDDLGSHLNPLVHTAVTDNLHAQQPPAVGGKDHLDAHRHGTGVVAGVRRGVSIGGAVGDALALQLAGIHAGRGHRQVEDLGNRGADGAGVGALVAEDDVVGHDAPLLVGRAGQRNHRRTSRHGVEHLNHVAQRIDVGVGAPHAVVDDDAAAGAEPESRLAGQPVLGPYADAQQHHVGLDAGTALKVHRNGGPRILKAPHPFTQTKAHALVLEVTVDDGRHREVERSHHLRRHLDHVDMKTRLVEVLGHLQTDEPAADHHRTPGPLAKQILLDGIRVGHAAQREDAPVVDALDGRTQRFGTYREHQLVVGLRIEFARGQAPHLDQPLFTVDAHHLLLGADVDAEASGEPLDALHEEFVAVGNRSADVVGQSAVGIGDILPPLEKHDVRMLVHSAQTGRNGGSARHAPDNQIIHVGLRFLLFI